MDRNVIKRFLDIVQLLLAFIILILFRFTDNPIGVIFLVIFFVLEIAIIIYTRIFWRCPKCKRFLPRNSLIDYVFCCPYCGANIEGPNKEKEDLD